LRVRADAVSSREHPSAARMITEKPKNRQSI
jgi:hypothetical protein